MFNSFAIPWTVASQGLLSLGFPRQEYWSGFPFPSAGDLSHPGMEPVSPALAGSFFTTETPGKPIYSCYLTSFFPFLPPLQFSGADIEECVPSDLTS